MTDQKDSHAEEYQVRDEASPRDYFAQVPNLVDIMDLSPHAYRLYGHLRRVAGESGRCWQSTQTLATACNMSIGKVSESKRELESVYPPLIRIESKKFDRGAYHEIAITDIWEMNHIFYTGGQITVKTASGAVFHNMNEWRSQCEKDRSQCETKKNPVKEEPITAANAANLSIENQIFVGVKTVTVPDQTEARRRDLANMIAIGMGDAAGDAYQMALNFQNERGITFTENDVKGQRKAIRSMLEKNVKPEHVTLATRALMSINFTVTSLFSVVAKSIDLANKNASAFVGGSHAL